MEVRSSKENWRETLKSFNILEHYELKGKSIYTIMYTEDVKIQENFVSSKFFFEKLETNIQTSLARSATLEDTS